MLSAAAHASPAELWTGVSTLAIAPLVEVGLRTLGLQRTARVLKVQLQFEGPPGAVAHRKSQVPLTREERRQLQIAWSVIAVGPFDATCLRRAMIGAWLLRSRKHAVRIGVRRTPDGVRAHAWLEIEGISLDPDAPENFVAHWQLAGTP
jgi:hypothetical protein